jgi:hypothetical protein
MIHRARRELTGSSTTAVDIAEKVDVMLYGSSFLNRVFLDAQLLVYRMSFNIFCKNDEEPTSPEEGGRSQCINCARMIRNDEIDEPMSFKWKTLLNYPQNRSCPDCDEAEIHEDPRNVDRHCQFKDESHGMYCCRCGTWMYKPTNVDISGWKCPNESCSFRKLG